MVMAVEDSTVRVVVRVRPPTPKELESQRRPVIQVVDEQMLVFDPEECDGGFPGLKWSGSHNGPKKKGKDLRFAFDRVFGEKSTQQDVFQHTTHNILDSFLQGYNCSGENCLLTSFWLATLIFFLRKGFRLSSDLSGGGVHSFTQIPLGPSTGYEVPSIGTGSTVASQLVRHRV